jgi:hypothetical protein
MSFPRYPKYKASGVAWLGEVLVVAGTLRVPTAESPTASAAANRRIESGCGTRSVPTTWEDRQ